MIREGERGYAGAGDVKKVIYENKRKNYHGKENKVKNNKK